MICCDEASLAANLSSDPTRYVASGYFGVTWLSRNHAIRSSVQGSTFRAYRGTQRYSPSSIFRTWAQTELQAGAWHSILNDAAKNQAGYTSFHNALNERLQAFWRHHDQTETLSFGRARKLTDLLMKHVLLSAETAGPSLTRLRQFIHVPLDRYTLKHISGVSAKSGIDLPPSKWTMGAVNEENYDALQNMIRKVTDRAQVDPIIFDIYAWNVEHPEITGRFIEQFGVQSQYEPSSFAMDFALMPKN